jgi:hypothetical protein
VNFGRQQIDLNTLTAKERAKLFGMTLYDYNKQAAYHEAGHAVLARVLGLNVTSVTILKADDRWAHVDCEVPPTTVAYEANLIVCWAGMAVDLKRDSKYLDRLAACSPELPMIFYGTDKDDSDATAKRLSLFKSGRIPTLDAKFELEMTDGELKAAEVLVRAAYTQAQVLVDQHWPAISHVAGALLSHKSLTQAQIDDLLKSEER